MTLSSPPDLPLPTTEGPAPGGAKLRISLTKPADVVAALPHLLGFVPTDSLVVVALHSERGRTEVGGVARIDLVAPEHVDAAAAACRDRLGYRVPDDVLVVVVGGSDPPGASGPEPATRAERRRRAREARDVPPPRTDVVAALDATFAGIGVPVRQRLWAERVEHGAPWRCYPPCGCRGTVPDPWSGVAAVASAAIGRVTYSSRAEVEALVVPDAAAAGPERQRLLDEAAGEALGAELLTDRAAARDALATVRRAALDTAAGRPLDDAVLARVSTALVHPKVRDAALAWCLGERLSPDPEVPVVPPGAAEALWTQLVRFLPDPEAAEPACLLAFSAIAHGGGALLGVAIERARAADPEHGLTGLLAAMLELGRPPEDLLSGVRQAARESEAWLLDATPDP